MEWALECFLNVYSARLVHGAFSRGREQAFRQQVDLHVLQCPPTCWNWKKAQPVQEMQRHSLAVEKQGQDRGLNQFFQTLLSGRF